MKRLKRCANGCDRPPDPPSLVICRPCQDKITVSMEKILVGLKRRPDQPEEER